MKDKPSKYPDIYHTCYSLSGMSISQQKENYAQLFSEDKASQIDLLGYTGHPKPAKSQIELLNEDEEGK